MVSKNENIYRIEKVIRLYAYPENYSVVWRGDITVPELFRKEEQIYKEYTKEFTHISTASEKEIHYLTSKDHYDFKLNGQPKAHDKHSDFQSENKDKITFARVDNGLFSLWADIYENNNKDIRSEIGITITKDIIKDIIILFEETNFKKKTFISGQKNSIVKKINSKYKQHLSI